MAELRSYYMDVNLVLGANMTLTDTINLFSELSKSNDDFWYLNILRRHLEQVAHIPVRNVSYTTSYKILRKDIISCHIFL